LSGRPSVEEERRRILEMVEQGRVSAQEANELLAALGEREERPPAQPWEGQRRFRRGPGEWGRMGQTVGDVVEAVMRSLFGGPEGRGQRRGRRQRREE
jgi:hypothetical protein